MPVLTGPFHILPSGPQPEDADIPAGPGDLLLCPGPVGVPGCTVHAGATVCGTGGMFLPARIAAGTAASLPPSAACGAAAVRSAVRG